LDQVLLGQAGLSNALSTRFNLLEILSGTELKLARARHPVWMGMPCVCAATTMPASLRRAGQQLHGTPKSTPPFAGWFLIKSHAASVVS
jgi:hypothetical protein